MSSLPADLLFEIAEFVDQPIALARTCAYIYDSVAPVLYRRLDLRSVQQCEHTLGMLVRRPDIARHVRELTVRPHGDYEGNYRASEAVRTLASTQKLEALWRFEWDGDELAMHDDMWFALRMGCPQMRHVATSIGFRLPGVNSHLFDFSGLSGFSLFLNPGFYDAHMDMFLDDQPIFQRLWTMLINRCPDLEVLAIEGLSSVQSVPADIRFLVDGRWPKLRKLSLGDVCIDLVPSYLNPGEKRPFISFLEAHPCLESLSLSRHSIQPVHFTSLDVSTLSRVSSFSGTHQQLQALPHLHRSLKIVDFRDPVETRQVAAPTVANLLRELPQLTTLKISFILQSMYDSGNLLRSLIQSCPLLRHLDLTCAHKPSFQLDAFAKTIRGFPKLQTLNLTIVKYPGDETLTDGAVRIAKSNPRLTQLTLTFIPPVCPVSLPFSIPYRPLSVLWSLPFLSKTSGTFEVGCDEHGLPKTLTGTVTTRFSWPWSLGSTSTTKRQVRDLRPNLNVIQWNTDDGLLGMWWSLMTLMCEKTCAGEEMRMMIFCVFLAVLAGCGVSAGMRSCAKAQGGSNIWV